VGQQWDERHVEPGARPHDVYVNVNINAGIVERADMGSSAQNFFAAYDVDETERGNP